jgi:hypothetical protein
MLVSPTRAGQILVDSTGISCLVGQASEHFFQKKPPLERLPMADSRAAKNILLKNPAYVSHPGAFAIT